MSVSPPPIFAPPPFTGKSIREALAKGGCQLQLLIPELIIQGGCTFIVAAPKAGKTTLAIQLAMHLTSGTPVFGALPVAEPCQVYYFAFETSFHRFIAKAERMQRAVPFNPDMLVFDPLCNGKDATDPTTQNQLIARIRSATDNRLRLIIIDPAYKMVPGGLGKDEVAGRFCAFLGRLNQETGAAVLVLHHSHREKWEKGEIVIERNPSFGSVWLIAHPDLMLQLAKVDGKEGVNLRVTEDREEICRPEMFLAYDTDTGTVTLDATDLTLEQRLADCLARLAPGTLLTTRQVANAVSCSIPSLKRLFASERVQKMVELLQAKGKPTVWKRL